MTKKIIYFFFIILLLFTVLNFLLAFIWPKITDHRISKGKFYSDEIINLIGIKPEERADFFKEMLIEL